MQSWEQAETRSQLRLWPLPSRPPANGSLRVYKQQAAEGASGFYGVYPKEAQLSSPQHDFTHGLHSSGGKKQISGSAACVNKQLLERVEAVPAAPKWPQQQLIKPYFEATIEAINF